MRELFAVIPKLPGVRVFEFAKNRELSRELADFCASQGHYLEIAALEDGIFEQLRGIGAKVRRFDETKERYNQRSMLFDTIFINYDLEKIGDKEQFFRKIYRMTKNAGDILFPIEPRQEEAMSALLGELNYVAINPIETAEGLYLSAKKLHGWARV